MPDRLTRRKAISLAMGAVAAGLGCEHLGMLDAEGVTMEIPKVRTDWMKGRWGLMVHWIAPGPMPEKGAYIGDLNRAVDAFQLDKFMAHLHETEASWLIFTIGQNSALYASPNSVLDRLVGPGHASNRDLVLEIAKGLKKQGKRFIGYLPAEVNAPVALHEGFAWNPKDQSEFQRRYTDFIREYAVRYGKLLSGWWYDGCYTWPEFHNSLYKWPLWAEASRAGNRDASLAFNDGSFCVGNLKPLTTEQDYLSGEVEVLKDGKIRLGREEDAKYGVPTGRIVEGTNCQWHALVPIDCFWGHNAPGPMEPPRYSDEDLNLFLRNCLSVGGAVTLNVGIYQEGTIGSQTLKQVAKLKKTINV